MTRAKTSSSSLPKEQTSSTTDVVSALSSSTGTLQSSCSVHSCLGSAAGISRSASLVLAYLIRYKRMKFEAALATVKSRRDIIHPNEGECFLNQLKISMIFLMQHSLVSFGDTPANHTRKNALYPENRSFHLRKNFVPFADWLNYLRQPLVVGNHQSGLFTIGNLMVRQRRGKKSSSNMSSDYINFEDSVLPVNAD